MQTPEPQSKDNATARAVAAVGLLALTAFVAATIGPIVAAPLLLFILAL